MKLVVKVIRLVFKLAIVIFETVQFDADATALVLI